MGQVRTWLALLVTALFLALSGTAFGAPSFFCHMTGRVGSGCCCQAKARSVAKPVGASVSANGCCERLEKSARPVVARTAALAEHVAEAALMTTVAEPSYTPLVSRAERMFARSSRGPPHTERLFVRHCAFLI
jgi:hypothetical protein